MMMVARMPGLVLAMVVSAVVARVLVGRRPTGGLGRRVGLGGRRRRACHRAVRLGVAQTAHEPPQRADQHEHHDEQQQPAHPVDARRQRPRRPDHAAHGSTLTGGLPDPWHHRHDMPEYAVHRCVTDWYASNARDLPWRRRDAGPWAVLVSEVMLQQTPVARVLPVYDAWMQRWPTPGALAGDSVGEALRMWGRLGYPRRARRLWQAACAINARFDGRLPTDEAELLTLPGVGEYTAAAVAAFAYRQRTAVLDTNVRRVLARLVDGAQFAPAGLSAAERQTARDLLPDSAEEAATWSVAVMELGALTCAARRPRCADCPVRHLCRWRALGYPASELPPRRSQAYEGTDRQCRGSILAALRASDGPVSADELRTVWTQAAQRERALASLIDDGLVVEGGEGTMALP
jgi:A/G-specific adenine glycosylase